MSLDIKRVCDRCGEEIPEGGEFASVTADVYQHCVNSVKNRRLLQFADKGTHIDLCSFCTEKLHDFICGKEKAE